MLIAYSAFSQSFTFTRVADVGRRVSKIGLAVLFTTKIGRIAPEGAALELISSKCIPVLIYG